MTVSSGGSEGASTGGDSDPSFVVTGGRSWTEETLSRGGGAMVFMMSDDDVIVCFECR